MIFKLIMALTSYVVKNYSPLLASFAAPHLHSLPSPGSCDAPNVFTLSMCVPSLNTCTYSRTEPASNGSLFAFPPPSATAPPWPALTPPSWGPLFSIVLRTYNPQFFELLPVDCVLQAKGPRVGRRRRRRRGEDGVFSLGFRVRGRKGAWREEEVPHDRARRATRADQNIGAST
jgi:hypothetical protein